MVFFQCKKQHGTETVLSVVTLIRHISKGPDVCVTTCIHELQIYCTGTNIYMTLFPIGKDLYPLNRG